MIKIKINQKDYEVSKDATIIEVADAHDIHIPRFCYHKKLSVAANCRMCLVEINDSGKTVPACHTKVTENMHISTNSSATKRSQQAVMEFLLANHPLDCPICDQGGECELQDLAVGYGKSDSNFYEEKRVVKDDDLGPLIVTHMTRCIHCTRCIRFTEEVCGNKELGMINRGSSSMIKTFLQQTVSSELSGNLVDICPVGALNAKPSAYSVRSWELNQKPQYLLNDCLGTMVMHHVKNNKVYRTVATNEQWIADYDRNSYLALSSSDAVLLPHIKKQTKWQAYDDFNQVVQTASKELKQAKGQAACLISPFSSAEELSAIKQFCDSFAIDSKDFKVHQPYSNTFIPVSTCSSHEFDQAQVIINLNCDLDKELPVLAAKVRANSTSELIFIGPKLPVNSFKYGKTFITEDLLTTLASYLKGLKKTAVIITGSNIYTNANSADLYNQVNTLAKEHNVKTLHLSYGANYQVAASLQLSSGTSMHEILASKPKVLVWYNLDPGLYLDLSQYDLSETTIIAFTPFTTKNIQQYAKYIIPIAPSIGMKGSLVNVFNEQKFFQAAIKPSVPCGTQVLGQFDINYEFKYFTHKLEYLNQQQAVVHKNKSVGKYSGYVNNLLLSKVEPLQVKRGSYGSDL